MGAHGRRFLACLIGCLLGACARSSPVVIPSAPATLTVLTWNMHGSRGDLPRLIDDLEAGRISGRPATDYVLLLQEFVDRGDDAVDRTRIRKLTLFASRVRSATGNAIVSSIGLDEPRTIDLPRERQPRGAVIATIRVAGETLFVGSTHLENRLGLIQGLFGDRARGRQAAALVNALPNGHGLVGGDFNTMLGPDEPAWQALIARFPDTPAKPEPTFRDRLVLDHLFFDLPDGWQVIRQVVRDRYGSDHHPVVASVLAPS